jgi:hypothetical protein
LAQLHSIFKANGIEDCVVGLTPTINEAIRGTEIKVYLDCCDSLESFVIIDDEEKMGDLKEHRLNIELQRVPYLGTGPLN